MKIPSLHGHSHKETAHKKKNVLIPVIFGDLGGGQNAKDGKKNQW